MQKNRYQYKNEQDRCTLNITHNRQTPQEHDVFINVEDTAVNSNASMSVQGLDEIKRTIYAIAVAGGLIADGDPLRLDKPSEPKVIPEDGTYWLKNASDGRQIAIVKNRKVFVPQVPQEPIMTDYTEVFLADYCAWELTPLTEKPMP